MGRLSAVASMAQSAVTMQQEKSRARFNTPDRPVRYSVLVIFRAMPSKRLIRTAISAPWICCVVMGQALARRELSIDRLDRAMGNTTRFPLSPIA